MIIPALDILDNKIVRLYKGCYNLVSYYDYNIYNLLNKYCSCGVKKIHLVDLNAARNPDDKQKNFISNLIKSFKGYIQYAGGIRHTKDIEYLLSLGVKSVVVGSSIINNFNNVKKWIQCYGNEFIVAALDVHIDNKNVKTVCINGWNKKTNITLEQMLNKLITINIKYVLCTDISKDGTLLGSNISLYQYLVKHFPEIHFQSSGGINSLHDISKLLKVGIKDIIIGKSLLENKFTISESILCWQKGLFRVLMSKKVM